MGRLFVVSNRVAVADENGKAAAGGLATALREALEKEGGTWFGWSGNVSEQPSDGIRIVQRGNVRYAVMDLSPLDHREYYNGFANRALWPTMHYRIGLSEFSRADFAGYQRVNRTFAQALAGLVEPDDTVWIHDYHLIPLGAELRRQGVTCRLGFFHHIPWPARDVFNTLPASFELLRAMYAYDLVGLQTEDDVSNLRYALQRDTGARTVSEDTFALPNVEPPGRPVRLKAFPIGIDVHAMRRAAGRTRSSSTVAETIRQLGGRKLLISVDRLDYSKGVAERMEAVHRFLISNPDERGCVSYLQIAPTSRSQVPEYAILSRTVNETLGQINGELGDPGWVPIHYVTKTYTRTVLAGLFRHARVGIVTPMRDGMNLVAKEFVAAQDEADPGVLILSKFAGAAAQLTSAILVNPYDKFETAEALREALFMDQRERIERWQAMLTTISEQDISWWTRTFLEELSSCSSEIAV